MTLAAVPESVAIFQKEPGADLPGRAGFPIGPGGMILVGLSEMSETRHQIEELSGWGPALSRDNALACSAVVVLLSLS